MSRAPFDPRSTDGPTVVIVNPRASRLRDPKRGERILADVEGWVREATGAAPLVIRVGDRSSIDAAGDRAATTGAGLVVAIGGDGTVAALASDLAGTGIPLGIVPGGTGNVLANAMGIPDRPDRAIDALRRAERRSIDLGTATLAGGPGEPAAERLFAVAAGVGWMPGRWRRPPAPRKHRFGKLAYWVAAFGLLGELVPSPYVIDVDGHRFEVEATVALVANAGELIPGSGPAPSPDRARRRTARPARPARRPAWPAGSAARSSCSTGPSSAGAPRDRRSGSAVDASGWSRSPTSRARSTATGRVRARSRSRSDPARSTSSCPRSTHDLRVRVGSDVGLV